MTLFTFHFILKEEVHIHEITERALCPLCAALSVGPSAQTLKTVYPCSLTSDMNVTPLDTRVAPNFLFYCRSCNMISAVDTVSHYDVKQRRGVHVDTKL